MRWRLCSGQMKPRAAVFLALLVLGTIQSCEGARRSSQRRKDSELELSAPAPSAESLQAIAQVMGAAGFETYTEGKALVKRLIPADSKQDVVVHQGIIGRVGVDFPAFSSIPSTGFSCKNVPTGYYADLETDCQVFHICDTSRKISFLCPNGTIFSQSHLICDWWFKVDCASAPALYESSAEYYSNEQKKTQRVTPGPTESRNLQSITGTNNEADANRATANLPSTTERPVNKYQKFNSEPFATGFEPSRNFHAPYPHANANPTKRTPTTTPFEKRQKNLVQLIANDFGNIPRRTTSPVSDVPARRSTTARNFIGLGEMQVAAETAAFAHSRNREFLQEYNKNYRRYPVYAPNLAPVYDEAKPNPTLTTLYDIRDKHLPDDTGEPTTKRARLDTYSKTFTELEGNHELYTRPGVSSLKGFLEKEKNKTLFTTEPGKFADASTKTDKLTVRPEEKPLTLETKSSFESVTEIPGEAQENNDYVDTLSSDKMNLYTTSYIPETTEPSYQQRRERLISKLNLRAFGPTEPGFTATLTEKYYSNLPKRPGPIALSSLTPKTLHSLAIYYATGLDNFATTPAPEESTTLTFDDYEAMEEGLPALFSQKTVNKYSNLFGYSNNNADLLEDIKLDPNRTYNDLAEDLSKQMSQNPLATSPQIRELAQVFTHALSAYLQDPVQFRKVLSDIRPTPPSFRDVLTTDELFFNTEPTTTVNEDDQEILGFSDDHKESIPVVSLRAGKSIKSKAELNNINDPKTTPAPSTTEVVTSTSTTTTPRTPFKCCGRISASYTSAAPPKEANTTPVPLTGAVQIKTYSNTFDENVITTTEYNNGVRKYGGFQNNVHLTNRPQYGKGSNNDEPINDYTEITNLSSAWGVDATLTPVTNGNAFESKRIKSTAASPITTPVYRTETESFELENEEELQRAHSQSFVAPLGDTVREGKQIDLDDRNAKLKTPSENLEAPKASGADTGAAPTTADPSTTVTQDQTESPATSAPLSVSFTSPDDDRTTYHLPTAYESWQSTIMLDPITLNDGLSSTGDDGSESGGERQFVSWTYTTSTTPLAEYTGTSDQAMPTTAAVELPSPDVNTRERHGRLLNVSFTEQPQDVATETVVDQAKEIMGGMNATTTEKLINVMMNTKSKTVKRLILLLIQTCDDNHNSTAEATKRALLEALMAVSQSDMEEVAKEQAATEYPSTTPQYDYVKTAFFSRRMDSGPRSLDSDRRGKSAKIDASAINSLTHHYTTESPKETEETERPTTSTRTSVGSRKPVKKLPTNATPSSARLENNVLPLNWPQAQARVAAQPVNLKADTRALELLRSLYTIAARWG